MDAVVQLLLQPVPQPRQPEAAIGGCGSDARGSSTSDEQPLVSVSITAADSAGSSSHHPVRLQLRTITNPNAQPAAAGHFGGADATAAAAIAREKRDIRSLPADVLAALLAVLERPDAPAARAAAAAALRRIVSAAAAAHASDLQPEQLLPDSADAAAAADRGTLAAATSSPVSISLTVVAAGGGAAQPDSDSCIDRVQLTLQVHNPDSAMSAGGPGSGSSPAEAVCIDLQPAQLADIAAAAAQAASDTDAATAAAAAALLADVSVPAALAASDSTTRQRLQEPFWRVQVRTA